MNYEELIKRWCDQQINRKTGSVEWKASPINAINPRWDYSNCDSHRMFCDSDILYSYGRHFPLAKRIVTNKGLLFLLNKTDYSPSTNRHRRVADMVCEEYGKVVAIEDNAISRKMLVCITDIEAENIIDVESNNILFRFGVYDYFYIDNNYVEPDIFMVTKEFNSVKDVMYNMVPAEVKFALRCNVDFKSMKLFYFMPTGMTTKELAKKFGVTQKKINESSSQQLIPTKNINGEIVESDVATVLFGMNNFYNSTNHIPELYARGMVYDKSDSDFKHFSQKLGKEWYLVKTLNNLCVV